MRRFPSIDILRGIAIVLMVLVHFVDNLSARDASSAWLYDACFYLGGLPAPLFTFLAGVSFSLWVRKEKASGRKESAITNTALRRGAFLFVAGLIFNFCIWLPEETFNWDVLTLLGSALVLLAFARHLAPLVLAVIGVLILLLSPAFRVIGDFPSYWVDDAFLYDNTPRDVLFGYVTNGYFPLLPWLLFPLVGYIVGELHFGRRNAPAWTLPAVGVGFIALAATGVAFGSRVPCLLTRYYATGYTEFPASTEYLLAMIGFCLLSLAALHRLCDRTDPNRPPGFAVRQLSRFSAYSLTLYILHHAVHLWPLWIYAAAMDHADSTFYWRKAIGTPWAFGFGIAFLLLAALALPLLERRKKLSFEWWLRRISG